MSSDFNCSASSHVIPLEDTIYAQSRWAFVTALSVIMMACAFIFTFVFWWGKRIAKYERLRVRRMALVYVLWLILMLHAQAGPGFVMYGIANFNCGLRSFITMMIVPLIAANIVLRLVIFFFLSELSKEMTQLQGDDVPVAKDENILKRTIRGAFDIMYALWALIVPSKKRMDRTRVISALTFVASAKGTTVIFVILLLPFLAVALALILGDETYLKCNGCKLAQSEVIEIIVVAITFLLFGIFAAFRVRHYPDPWELRREASLMCVGGVVILIGFCLGTFNDPPRDVTYDHQLIIVIGFLILAGVQTVYQVGAAYYSERATVSARKAIRAKREEKKQKRKVKSVVDESLVNSTTNTQYSDRLVLKHVLANPVLCAEFEKFLVSELGVESLMFLRDTDAWKKVYFDVAPSARLARAKRLFNTYISPTGSFPVNIPSDQIAVIRGQIMREGLQDCKEDVFDMAREEIHDLLQVGAVMRFQLSKQYKHFVDEYGMKGREIQSTEL